MARKKILIGKAIGMLLLVFLSTTFLMGDFCTDIFSVPFRIDHATKNPIVFDVDFAEGTPAPPEGDGDIEYNPDADMELEGEIEYGEFELLKVGNIIYYSLPPQHKKVDFTSGKGKGLKDYKDKIVGIFVRSVSYSMLNTNSNERPVPGLIPRMEIYLSPKISPPNDSDPNDLPKGAYDWDGAISKEDHPDYPLSEWELKKNGVNKKELQSLVLLGRTHDMLWYLNKFPASETPVDRQGSNVDEISEIIKNNFRFEVVVRPEKLKPPSDTGFLFDSETGLYSDPKTGYVVDESGTRMVQVYCDELFDDCDSDKPVELKDRPDEDGKQITKGTVKLKLRFRIVLVAKVY